MVFSFNCDIHPRRTQARVNPAARLVDHAHVVLPRDGVGDGAVRIRDED